MNRVVNVRKDFADVYMGREMKWHRQSPWHNPFHIGNCGSREEAIAKFAEYFYAPEQKWLRDKALAEISPEAVLGCWCAPKSCRAEIVAGYLAWKRQMWSRFWIACPLIEIPLCGCGILHERISE